jgi:iron complex transport system substrate-binding protein
VIPGLHRLAAALAAALAALPAPGAPATPATPERPARIVSLNLAADQLLLVLADRPQIAALTWFAADPALSAMAAEARGIPSVRGEAEEVILLRPDVVFVGRWSAPATTRFLRNAGLRLIEVHDPPNSFPQIEDNIRAVGDAAGHPDRADDAIARLRAARAEFAASPPPGRPLRILPYEFNNWTPGRGVLLHSLILEAGHRAVSDELRIEGYGRAGLEEVLLARPDVVLCPRLGDRPPAMVNLLFQHPVWSRAGAPALVEIPQHAGQAAGLDSVALARALRTLGPRTPYPDSKDRREGRP